jgi:hypothetical protein
VAKDRADKKRAAYLLFACMHGLCSTLDWDSTPDQKAQKADRTGHVIEPNKGGQFRLPFCYSSGLVQTNSDHFKIIGQIDTSLPAHFFLTALVLL